MPNIVPKLDNKTYYQSENITIYPSSNAVDGGKLGTELNFRNTTINITDLNYVVSPNPNGYSIAKKGTEIVVQPGKAIINGFEVLTSSTISYRFPTADEITSEGYYSGYALLCLHTNFDALDNLWGNAKKDLSQEWYCMGINIQYVSYADYTKNPGEYLLLGGVKTDGTIKENKDRFNRIDAKYIKVDVKEDQETELPPTQTTNLDEFIDNYLKGYWVSKAGDNEYGPLLFKSKPTGYDAEGFEYKKEDKLDSKNYSIKINRIDDTDKKGYIVVKPEVDDADNLNTLIYPSSLSLYKGTVVEDETTLPTEKANIKLVQSDSNSNKHTKLQLKTDNVIHLSANYNNPDTGLSLFVEDTKVKHNDIPVGHNVYATDGFTTVNYLYDGTNNNSISTNSSNGSISLDSEECVIDIISKIETFAPELRLQDHDSNAGIFSVYDFKEGHEKYWVNTIVAIDNLVVNNNIATTDGFIVAGTTKIEPKTITVPDIANNKANRGLQAGDIWGTQVWSAVYNDIAEIFQIHKEDKDKIKPGTILAVDKENPDYYVVADDKNICVVGVVSENPAFCCGGQNVECGVPVALAGRVTVNYSETNKPEIGSFVGLDINNPGYCCVTKNNIVGKVIDNREYKQGKIKILVK